MDRLGVAKPFAWKFGKNGATGRSGFTLVEMLVVLAIMAIIALLVLPSLNGLFTSNSFTSNIYTLDGTLQQARSYAMANNTCVYVGIGEWSPASTISTAVAGNGRVVILVTAVNDGSNAITGTTSPFKFLNTASYPNTYLNQINKLVSLNNLHIVNLLGFVTGNMQRPQMKNIASAINVATTPVDSTTTSSDSNMKITYPLTGTAVYTFPIVIGFDPTGSAYYVTSLTNLTSTTPTVIPYIEIGLEPTHGTTVPAAPGANIAAIQIDGLSGITHIYRP